MRLTTAGAIAPLDLKGKGTTSVLRASQALKTLVEAAEEWLPGSQQSQGDPDPARNRCQCTGVRVGAGKKYLTSPPPILQSPVLPPWTEPYVTPKEGKGDSAICGIIP